MLDLVYLATDEKQAQIAREAIQDIRSIASIPVETPELLSDWVAKTRLESMQRIEKHTLLLNWPILTSSFRLTGRQNYHLTHIIRELISNTIKHAYAKKIGITISIGGGLVIEYTDDGVGFAVKRKLTGSGMAGIRRRMKEIQGGVEWSKSPSSGTCVVLSIPIAPDTAAPAILRAP